MNQRYGSFGDAPAMMAAQPQATPPDSLSIKVSLFMTVIQIRYVSVKIRINILTTQPSDYKSVMH